MKNEGDAKSLAEFVRLIRGDAWAAGDYLAERFSVDDYPVGTANNALYHDLDRFRAEISKTIGEDVATTTMRVYRATAVAWSDDIRISSATFQAHAAMRGRPDRVKVIANYVKRSKREGSIRLNHRQVARYRAEDNPRPSPVKSQTQRISGAIRRAAKRELLGGIVTDRTDFWNAQAISSIERESLLAIVESFAAEIRASL